MAGVVVSDAQWNRMARRLRLQVGKNFGNVFAFFREFLCAIGIMRIVAKEIAVIFHVRAAAGGVVDDHIDFGALEDVNGSAREIKRLRLASSVDHQRAAATLISRNYY